MTRYSSETPCYQDRTRGREGLSRDVVATDGGVTVCVRCGERVSAGEVDEDGECLMCRETPDGCDPRVAMLKHADDIVATDGGEDQDGEEDEDDEGESRRLDNPHWRDRFVPDGGERCWYCGLENHHPTCDRPGCEELTHGTGPDGKRVPAYCRGHRSTPPAIPDGGRVQDERRQCARCDADAIPGSRFCLGHSEVRPDGGRSPDDFEVDPRNMSIGRTPAVLEERLGDGDTSRVSFADFELHESGAVKFTQFDGRKGLLPQWRWTDIEFIPTEGFTDHGQSRRRKRVSPEFWSLLPKQVKEVFDRPEREEIAAGGGVSDE